MIGSSSPTTWTTGRPNTRFRLRGPTHPSNLIDAVPGKAPRATNGGVRFLRHDDGDCATLIPPTVSLARGHDSSPRPPGDRRAASEGRTGRPVDAGGRPAGGAR